MAFGRKKKANDDVVEEVDGADVAATPEVAETAGPGPTSGPFDPADAPDDDLARIDLGSLRVPIPEGVELRVDVGPEGEVVSATAVHRASQLQLNAFAAPRNEGIWAEVRVEITESLRQQGGSAEEADGPFGVELRARIPAQQAGMTQPARFIGVDGPRWFVRALLVGPAATDPAQADVLVDVFRQTVVVRGGEAMAPRDPLPLHLPRDIHEAAAAEAEAAAAADAEAGSSGDDFNPFERGPEITEVR